MSSTRQQRKTNPIIATISAMCHGLPASLPPKVRKMRKSADAPIATTTDPATRTKTSAR